MLVHDTDLGGLGLKMWWPGWVGTILCKLLLDE